MDFFFQGINGIEFARRFQSDDDCFEYLYALKWKDGYQCRACGCSRDTRGRTRFHRRCSRCRYDESVLSHTLLQDLKMPVLKAFYMLFHVVTKKKGMSSVELSTEVDVQQKTAWKFKLKVKSAMAEASEDLAGKSVKGCKTVAYTTTGRKMRMHAKVHAKAASSPDTVPGDRPDNGRTGIVGDIKRPEALPAGGPATGCEIASIAGGDRMILMQRSETPAEDGTIIAEASTESTGGENPAGYREASGDETWLLYAGDAMTIPSAHVNAGEETANSQVTEESEKTTILIEAGAGAKNQPTGDRDVKKSGGTGRRRRPADLRTVGASRAGWGRGAGGKRENGRCKAEGIKLWGWSESDPLPKYRICFCLWLRGIHHHCSRAYLGTYYDEYFYRFDFRYAREFIFHDILERLIGGAPRTHPSLRKGVQTG